MWGVWLFTQESGTIQEYFIYLTIDRVNVPLQDYVQRVTPTYLM